MGALAGLRVLDMSRILAGPTATQLLSDLGAEVIKIERPGRGDDTRGWGPPFLKDRKGNETRESAYYMCANRGKKSLAIDIARTEGQELVSRIADQSDILIENFKAGDLKRRGLDYATLAKRNPRLVYCSITGFGQTGPYKDRAGYDFLIQGMGGIMSLSGSPDGPPMKTGVGIADVMTGMYAVAAILSAIHARTTTGRGQHIDLSLFDCQVSWLINQGTAYLTDGEVPPRRGNEHPTIVPYGTFPASDGDFILAVGNDDQFARFCAAAGAAELARAPEFATNAARVRNRGDVIARINDLTRRRTAAEWISTLEPLGVPCGPINDLGQVFAHPVTAARDMKIALPHPISGSVDLIGNPIKLSDTPTTYQGAPPTLGQHSADVLANTLGLSEQEIAALVDAGVVEIP